jgi:solute:Na+ symporter, SSS family
MNENRTLDAFSLAALLVSAHYGLGFILGTAEQSLTNGIAGSLYAVSLSLGTIALMGLAKFYWTQVEQIWTLLGSYCGNEVKVFVGLMSWASLIGIESVQLISGAFILKVLGAPTIPTMLLMAILFAIISLVPVEKASWVFRGLLLLNFLALLYALWVLHGVPDYLRAPLTFTQSLQTISLPTSLGISLSTILLLLIDMRYQQFIVRAKNVSSVYKGCILAGIILFLLALLPSSVVVAALKTGILPTGIGGKETLAFILLWIGGGTDKFLSLLLIASLLVPALGVGSSTLRVQSKIILDFKILPASNLNRVFITIVNAILSLIVALKGGEIVILIVSFYSAYVGGVIVPFFAYLLSTKGVYTFSKSSIKISLILGSISAIILLVTNLFVPSIDFFGNIQLNILIPGIIIGIMSLFISQVTDKYLIPKSINENI